MAPIRGVKETLEALRLLGPAIENRVMRSAVLTGAKVLRDKARTAARNAHVKVGAVTRLRDAIRAKPERRQAGHVVAGIYIASQQALNRKSNDPRSWWWWQDDGTDPRRRGGRSKKRSTGRAGGEINPATGKRRGRKVSGFRAYLGEMFRVRNGNTGRITATHWLTDEFDNVGPKEMHAVEKRAEQRLNAEVKKIAKKAPGL